MAMTTSLPWASGGRNGIGGATMMLAMPDSSSGAVSAAAMKSAMTWAVAGSRSIPPTIPSRGWSRNFSRVATPQGQPVPAVAGQLDHLGARGGVGRADDGRRAALESAVEDRPGLVVAGVVGGDDAAVDGGPQPRELDGGRRRAWHGGTPEWGGVSQGVTVADHGD